MATVSGSYVTNTVGSATCKWRAQMTYGTATNAADYYSIPFSAMKMDLAGGSSTTIKCTKGNTHYSLTSSIAPSSPSSLPSKSSGYPTSDKNVYADDDWTMVSSSTLKWTKTHSARSVTVSWKVQQVSPSSWKGTSTASATFTIPAKTSYTVSYSANGGVGAPINQTKWYNESLNLQPTIPIKVGYIFKCWNTNPAGTGTNYNPNQSYTGNAKLDLYAQWTPNTFVASFNLNGGTGSAPARILTSYDSSFTFPANTSTRKNYIFKGWSIDPNVLVAEYEAGQSIVWKFLGDVIFYAIWELLPIRINYHAYLSTTEDNFDKATSYRIIYTTEVPIFSQYTIEDFSAEDLTNYTFSGYWNLEDPYSNEITEYDITFPKGIIPYDYVITDKDNFLTAGDSLQINSEVNLYPVYRDNTKSIVTKSFSSYEYIKESVQESDYYLYISDQINNLNLDLYSKNIVAGVILKSKNKKISIDISSIHAVLYSANNENEEIELNPVFYRSLNNLDSTSFYIIYRTTGEEGGTLVNYETTKYILDISGIKDTFGKSLDPITIDIIPPSVLQDINKNGDVISFFTKAPDDDTLEENQVLISGNIIIGLPRYLQYDSGGTISLDTQLYSMITSLGLEADIIEINI